MDATTIAALISAGAAVVAAAAQVVGTMSGGEFGGRDLRKAFLRKWIGRAEDLWTPADVARLTYEDCILELRQNILTRSINGTMSVPVVGDTRSLRIELRLFNGVVRERTIQIHYRNVNTDIKELGVIMLQLSDNNDELNGYFSGWAPKRKNFVMGSLSLEKAA